MSEQTSSNVPQIRFKGFDEQWDEKTLGNVLGIENGFAFKSKCFCDDKTGVVVLTPGSVKIGGGFQDGKGHFYKSNDDIPIKYKFESGDIFITLTDLTPTAQALGYPARVPDDGVIYLHNQRLGKLVGFDGDIDFLFQLLSTEKYHRIIVSTSSGTTVKHSSPLKVLSVESHFPTIAEQTQIGKYFRELDSLIGLHQRKHDKLGTLKKAMLQKMFPQSGVTTPEIRFKGFSSPWDSIEMEKLGQTYSGLFGKTKDDFGRGDGRFVTYMGVFNHTVSNLNVTDAIGVDPSQNEVRKGDVLFTISSETPHEVGMSSVWSEDTENVYLNSFCFGFRPLPSLKSDFLAYVFRADEFRKRICVLAQGISRYNISKIKVMKIPVSIPDPAEQQKIGTYFRTLDALISQHATQLQKLQQIKSACLERMFV